MEMEEIIQVEDHFLIDGRGLVLMPLLPPPKGPFKPSSSDIRVRKPDGTDMTIKARFAVEHFTLVGGKGKCHLVVMLPEAQKSDIPKGTKILVSAEIVEKMK